MEEENMTMFEVETTYKSGFVKTDFIPALTEEEMWNYYDKHHNLKIIDDMVIADAYPY